MASSIYFVGAGMSKAIQTSKPVPLMVDFVKVASEYAEHDPVSRTMLLGFERLGLFDWPATTAGQLAERIESRRSGPADVKQFLFELRRRPSESVETLLSQASRSNVGPFTKAAYQPVVRFRYAIGRIFSLIGWDVNSQLVEQFVAIVSGGGEDHTFVSFNYDLFLDRAIHRTIDGWHPRRGYGFEIPYYVTEDPDGHGVPVLALPHTGDQPRVRILKPHGSLNWLVPIKNPNAAMPFGDGPVTLRLDEDFAPEYVGNADDWPRVTLPDKEPTDVAPGIIAPLSRKDARLESFVVIREKEFESVRTADTAYIVGWSIPVTDEDQLHLIGYAVQQRDRPFERVVIINRDQGPEYYDRIARLFGVERGTLEIWNNGFQDWVDHQSTTAAKRDVPSKERPGCRPIIR